MMRDISELAKKFYYSLGNSYNITIENRYILDFFRSLDYADTFWNTLLGSPLPFGSYVKKENPKLYDKFIPYIRDTDRLEFVYKGQNLDLAHLAATTLGYFLPHAAPNFWTGWGGDLATAMADISEYKDINKPLESDQSIADNIVVGYKGYSCSTPDIKADIDALHFKDNLKLDRLDKLFETYYSIDYRTRKNLILNDIETLYAKNPIPGVTDLGIKIYCVMSGNNGIGYVGAVGGLALRYLTMYNLQLPTNSVQKAVCNAFANYISNKL